MIATIAFGVASWAMLCAIGLFVIAVFVEDEIRELLADFDAIYANSARPHDLEEADEIYAVVQKREELLVRLVPRWLYPAVLDAQKGFIG